MTEQVMEFFRDTKSKDDFNELYETILMDGSLSLDEEHLKEIGKLWLDHNGHKLNPLIDEIEERLTLAKDEEEYTLDAFGNRISFNGLRTIKKAHTKLSLHREHIIETEKCRVSYKYFRANYCKILNPKGGYLRPDPREYQDRLEDDLLEFDKVVALFSRQSGKTVTVACYLLWKAIFKTDINIGIAANKHALADEVLDKIKNIFLYLPLWLAPGLKTWNKQSIKFEHNTSILTAATNGDSFRGFSISTLFVDEVAFISPKLWKEFGDAVFPSQAAIEDSETILTSTANGYNQFYNYVEGARKGASTTQLKNGLKYTTSIGKNRYKLSEMLWHEVPGRGQEFKENIIATEGILYWNQNFGNEFLGSSATLVDGECLKGLEYMYDDQITFDKIFHGLKIFKKPEKGRKYIVSCDPSLEGTDKTAMQVLDITEFPFEQVAVANLNESYMLTPSRIFDLGTYYNNALVVIENNIDSQLADTLYYQYEYENIYKEKKINSKKRLRGVRTTTRSKRLMLSTMKRFMESSNIIIHDQDTIDQFFNFIEKDNGTFSAEEGFFDDLVMALAIAFFPFMEIKAYDGYKDFVAVLDFENEVRAEDAKETLTYIEVGSFVTQQDKPRETDSFGFDQDEFSQFDQGFSEFDTDIISDDSVFGS